MKTRQKLTYKKEIQRPLKIYKNLEFRTNERSPFRVGKSWIFQLHIRTRCKPHEKLRNVKVDNLKNLRFQQRKMLGKVGIQISPHRSPYGCESQILLAGEQYRNRLNSYPVNNGLQAGKEVSTGGGTGQRISLESIQHASTRGGFFQRGQGSLSAV